MCYFYAIRNSKDVDNAMDAATRIRTWAVARRIVLTVKQGRSFLLVRLTAEAARDLAEDLRWAEDLVQHKPDHMPQFHEIQIPDDEN